MKKFRHFEEVIKQVGSLGRFQWCTYALMQYSMIFQAFNQNMMAFGKIEPPVKCDYTNTTTDAYSCRNSSIYCTDTDKVEFHSIVLEWNLFCDLAHVPITIISIQMLGLIPGSLFFNHLIDNYGRKWSSHLLTLGVFILGLSSAFSISWQMFAVFRFLIGFLFGGLFMVTIVLQMEILEEKDRTFIYALDFWSVGNCVLSLLAFLTRDWKTLVIVSNCLCIPLLFLWYGVQESPRWLLQQGRMEEAHKILNRIARWNRKPSVTVESLQEIVAYSKGNKEKLGCTSQHSIFDIFTTKKSSLYFLTLAFGWLTCSCINYGLLYDNTSWAGNPFLNFTLANAIRMMFQALFVIGDKVIKIRRRLQYLIPLGAICVMITSVTIIALFQKNSTSEIVMTTIGLISTGMVGLLWLMICILPVELFPTVIRHIALGGCSVAARIGGVLGPQLLNMVS